MQITVLNKSSVLASIDDETIIEWINVEKSLRIPKVVSVIIPFDRNTESGLLEWKSLPLRLIESSNNPTVVLNEYKKKFYPMSWSGSLAYTLKARLPLIADLKNT